MADKDANILNCEVNLKAGKVTHILSVKNYVYETVNGKRKRVSPYVFNEKGEISEIRQRAIIAKYKVPEKPLSDYPSAKFQL